MFRKLTLSIFLTVCAFAINKTSFAFTYTDYGSSTPYTLIAGDTLFIASGTYTGTVSGLNSNNRTIIVASGATFQPTSLAPTNGVVCKMIIYGTFTYTQPLTTNTNFTLDIYAGGIVTLAAMNTKGRDQVWTNHIGGTLNFTGDVLINGGTLDDDNNVFINYETINASGNFQMNSGSALYNYKDFFVTGSVRVNGGTLENHGKLDVTGNILVNNGASVLKNYCKLIAAGGITNTSGNFYNYNYVYANNSDIINTTAITNGSYYNSIPIIQGRNYTHSNGGTMTGSALLYFTGTTKISGGTMGVPGVTSDTIKVYDITRTNPPHIFDDTTGGTQYPNVIYNEWGVPDPTRVYLVGCSMEILMDVPLAINWNSFSVNLSGDNIPVLNWSASYEQGTVFEIQRGYDGRNFSPIGTMGYETNQTDYSYNDISVDKKYPFAYYRIKAVLPGGAEKYTQVRVVRFNTKMGTLRLIPNPFTNNFFINYEAAKKEELTIEIFNTTGQQIFMKNVAVDEGGNRISVDEASRFTSGIYIVQVSSGSRIISSGKIIKK